jgi:outer membrane protein assembly factor BamB
MRALVPVALLLVLPLVGRAADHWPAFRGGALAGVAEAKPIPATWDVKTNVHWKVEVPGAGWSSPVVWGNRVFLTATISKDRQKEPRKGLYLADLRGTPPPGEHERIVLCFDGATGKTLWQRTSFKGAAKGTIHLKNSLASETPVTDGKRIYAYFGNTGVVCYDLAGKELWKVTTPAHRTRMGWGTAASPALHGDRLFIVHDNEERPFLLALDACTGKQLWRVERKGEGSNWATPFVWQNDKRTELVTAGSKRVRSYDLDGKLLWELRGMSIISIPTPFARHGLLYVSSGYVGDPFLRPVWAIRPGGSGDITLPDGERSGKFVAWCQSHAGPYHPTPLVYGDYLYILYDRGVLACYEAKTGKEVYSRQRLTRGAAAFTASPWANDGKVFCLSEDGETFVVEAGPRFKLLGRNKLGEMALATPALTDRGLFLRTQKHLYCLRRKAK